MTTVDLTTLPRRAEGDVGHTGRSGPARGASASGRQLPFQLRGTSFTTMVLRLAEPVSPRFERLLAEKVAQAPGFFKGAPVVLDLSDLPEGSLTALDLAALIAMLKAQGLIAVGIRAGGAATDALAAQARLALFPAGRPSDLETREAAPRPVEPPPERARERPEHRGATTAPIPPSRTTRVVTEPVRSGQQIYHDGGDLIVMAAVGSGAEVIAAGHVHIYGALRGRAIAGVAGDATARIWCASLDAELVSVAGVYMISDRIDPALRHQRVQIAADGDNLRFERLP